MTGASGVSLLNEAVTLVRSASEEGVVLRLLGALAIQHRCPEHWRIAEREGRATVDVDLVAAGNQWSEIVAFFEGELYEFDERHAMLHGKERLNFFHPSGFRVDVFLDKLNMCHRLNLRWRLGVDPITVPLPELLLQKLQIVELTRKDVIDVLVLLREHGIAEDDPGLSGPYIARLLSSDWGFYHTATQNLMHLRDESIYEIDELSQGDREVILARIESLLSRIEENPKTLGFRARARIGTRVKWYQDVDELTR